MVNFEWQHLFPEASLLNLFASISDHTRIILHTKEEVHTRYKRAFKFENIRLNEEGLEGVVHGSWGLNPHVDVFLNTSWTTPPVGFLKCNINAAFQESNGVTSWGFCCRAKGGAFKLARSKWQHPCLPVPIPSFRPLESITMDGIYRFFSHNFEMDCKEVVDKANSICIDISDLGSIILQRRYLIFQHPNYTVQFARRHANVVAHSLASAATYYFDDAKDCSNKIKEIKKI
ncbi:hypothetical protein GYH30_009698 [Glycine max]|uniref:RNase H type-1 domain-containing protein n=1 Tax=Glycine max TaxID=3847 RepID=A0A0R0KCF3_SOYBN|nr:hypothetical protein JHK86_009828 [Glycine max]KAH1111024.1 hypothetical protein GYH30_009698 [Glycine max]